MTQTLLLPPEHEKHLLPERTRSRPERIVRETRERAGSLFDHVKNAWHYVRTVVGKIFSSAPTQQQQSERRHQLTFKEHREEGWVPFEER